jgi:hypothetical protein
MLRTTTFILIAFCILGAVLPKLTYAQGHELPLYLRDRGPGLPTSMFGMYISKGELLVYLFSEYTHDKDREYQPAQFGFGPNQDYFGKYRSSEGLIFIGYGLTDWLALEVEAAFMNAVFEKSPSDMSATPAKIKESGFGDIEGQIRLRWLRENDHRPEFFSFLDIAVPSQKHKLLIGAPDWDLKPGFGIIRGFSWGTIMLRTDLEYNREASRLDIGETAVEYLRRLSPSWRLYLGVEGGEGGAPDEWSLISGVQWRIADFLFLKLDNALGISSKATEWASEIGCLISFPVLRP